jgi:hypothetical protein
VSFNKKAILFKRCVDDLPKKTMKDLGDFYTLLGRWANNFSLHRTASQCRLLMMITVLFKRIILNMQYLALRVSLTLCVGDRLYRHRQHLKYF